MAVIAFVLAASETALPAVLGRAIDSAVGGDPSLHWATVTLALVAVLVVAEAADDVAVGYTVAGSTAWLRRTLLGHVLSLNPTSTARPPAGDLAARMVAGGAEAGRAGPHLVRLLANLVPGVGSLVALAWIDPWLLLVFVAGLPVVLVTVRTLTRAATDAGERYQQTQGHIAGTLVEALGGAPTIAAAATVDREVDRVLRRLPELRRHGLEMWRSFTGIAVQQALVLPALELAVLAAAGLLLAAGRISPGELVAAAGYAGLGAQLAGLEPLTQLTRSRAGAARIAEALVEPSIRYGGRTLPRDGRGRIELRGVTASLDGARVLEDVDLDVPPGALIGVAGPDATLLTALLLGFLRPDTGQVLLDGVPLDQLTRSGLRRAVAYASARPALLGETVADVIAFGDVRPGTADIAAGARFAQADSFVRRLPAGYRTSIVDAPLSGGETQRLGLARAFAHDSRVLVLEDVAASLDTVTEHLIQQVLTGRLKGRTRVVVARRASTAAAMDVVAWLDGGRLRAVAPHDRLWDDPDYRALFQEQS